MFTLCAKKSNGIRNALIPLAHRRDSVYLPKYNIVLLNKELCKSFISKDLISAFVWSVLFKKIDNELHFASMYYWQENFKMLTKVVRQ